MTCCGTSSTGDLRTLRGIANVRTGRPPLGPGACVADKITTKPCKDWLNPSSFVAADLRTFGNVGKGGVRFPGFYSWDMSLSKTFSFTERWKLQFRAEYFNVFNRVNYLSDDSTVGPSANFAKVNAQGSAFGAIAAATDPRIGQLALKIFF
jgi:hypothetical protein